MIIRSLELENFRNCRSLKIDFSEGTNILYGDNAQGKTNILEAIFISSTTRSHKSSKDKDIIHFGGDDAHIRTYIEKDKDITKVDMHLRGTKSKGIAINNQSIKRAAELMGILNVVFFSPEDLAIIKDGPSERRRFVDMDLCQLDGFYLYNLTNYNRVVTQRNKLLKDIQLNPELKDSISVWDEQLVKFGIKLIDRRNSFAGQLNRLVKNIHKSLSGHKEELNVFYEPNVSMEDFEAELANSLEKDIKLKQTNVGPHRDDFAFYINEIDIRKFGSQGQQRTAALSLKLAEIDLIKRLKKDVPVLLLDDVLSELDSKRQNYLLKNIGSIQTIITCTGLDDFVSRRFNVDRVFRVVDGDVMLLEEGLPKGPPQQQKKKKK